MKADLSFLYRKKKYDQTNIQNTQLDRVLGLIDITALGVSCTLGNGIYVLAGDVIANYAGPSIVLCFIIAGMATCIAGICYAEFGARLPRSGSAYIYIYVSIGEFVAFILGWDLILEYVIGVSSGASALSNYIDSLSGNQIKNALRKVMPIDIEYLSSYPDFLSFGFIMVITLFMIVGVRESAMLNKAFTLLNICVIAFIFISGLFFADIKNWQIDPKNLTSWVDNEGNNQTCESSQRCGEGGFLAFGFSGIIRGAAKCFYAYIGFDAIASTGEEVQNPKRNLPLSIALTLIVGTVCYCSVSVVLTLMLPYYIVDPEIPIPQAFEYVGLNWAKTLVSVGAIASLITCLYASMFPMPRVVYALASDGLIFKQLAVVMPKLKTPVTAAIASGFLAGLLALIFDLNQLIDMMSIGTLMAYSVVAVCVLVLRYRPPDSDLEKCGSEAKLQEVSLSGEVNLNAMPLVKPIVNKPTTFLVKLFGYSDEPLSRRLFTPASPKCTRLTSRIVNVFAILSVFDVFFLALTLSLLEKDTSTKYIGVYLGITAVLVCIAIFNSFVISRQPQDETITTFKIPCISFLPFISVFVNIYLMMALSLSTWIPFGIWFVLGIIVYFSYGVRHSNEIKTPNEYF